MHTLYGEKNTAITGIGQSLVSRPAATSALSLTVDACLAAIEDAGLRREDIDGISTYPGAVNDATGFSPVGLTEVREALGLRVTWHSAGGDGPSQLTALFNAIGAIAAGFATHVLIFRTVYQASARAASKYVPIVSGGGQDRVWGHFKWMLPFKGLSAAPWAALYAQRHFHDFGTKPEELGQIAVTARRHAKLNPASIFREEIAIGEYLASRFIATPLRLYDCDVPVDGATALVVSRREAAVHLRNEPLQIEAIGSAVQSRDSWFRPESFTSPAVDHAARMMWGRTDLKPGDVDVAQLYDGFSIFTLLWLEAMGFCGKGEAGSYVAGGQRIALDGQLPLNTGGGQLSAGRLHGFGHVHEACVQLWGRGGDRQVGGGPTVAAVSNGGAGFAGCMLLRRD